MIIHNIYRLVNQTNGKVYIGYTSKSIKTRMNEHRSGSNKRNTKLYAAIRKYGWENFKFDIIYQSLDGQHCLKTMEKYFIKEYDSLNNGYNLTEGGDGTLGNNPSEETRIKMSLSHRGKTSHRKGKTLPEETRKRMSLGHVGTKASIEHKRNISEGLKNQLRVECPHCKKFGAIGNMKRYHFDKCSYITQSNSTVTQL